MKQKSYRRQVARKAFDPIQAPDVSTRILQESENTIRGMRDVQEAELRNRQEYLNSLKDTQRLEETVREKNFNLKTEFAEAYRDAELQHYKTRLNDVKTEEFENEQFNKLKTLIPKAFKNYVDFEEQRGERLKEIGAEIATRWGLSAQEAKAFKFAGQNIDWADAAMNRVKLRLEKGGASPEVLMQVMNLSGRKLLGAQELLLSNAGKNHYPQFLNENLHTKIPGLNMSLADMEGDEKGVYSSDYRAGMRYWESKYIAKFQYGEEGQGYDDAFVAKHLRPYMDSEHDTRMAAQFSRDTNAYKAIELETQTTNLQAKVFGDGGKTPGQGFLEWINSESGGDPDQRGRARRLGASIFTEMAKTGELTREQWNTIRNTSVKVGEKEVLLGDQWKDDFVPIEEALNDRARLVEQQEEAKWKSFDQLQQQRVVTATAEINRRLNDAELDTISIQYKQEFPFREVPSWINTYRNTETLDIQSAKSRLDGMVEDDNLTMATLYGSPWIPKELYADYAKKTRDGPNKADDKIKTQSRNAVKNAISEVAKNTIANADQRTSDVLIMEGYALKDLSNKVLKAVISGKYKDADSAWLGESTELAASIKKNEGKYSVITDPKGSVVYGDGGGFNYIKKEKHRDTRLSYYLVESERNKGFITLKAGTPGAISLEDLNSLEEEVQLTNKLPTWLLHIASAHPTKDPWEVMNTILTYNGRKTIEPIGGAKAYGYVHPTVKRIFSNKPTLAKTARAMSITTKLTNQDLDSFNPMLDLIKSKEVMEADTQYDGFDAMQSPNGGMMSTGTLIHKKPLTEMTVSEIVNNQNKGRTNVVGAFQIEPGQLDSFIARGFVSETDLFDEATQRKLGAIMLWERAGSFFSNSSLDAYAPIKGIGQEWGHVKGEDKIYQEDEKKVILNKLYSVKTNLLEAGFDPLQFREEINDTLLTLTKGR